MNTITPSLRVDKKYKNGKCPIFFRLSKNKKSTYIPTNIAINIDDWDYQKKAIKKSHPFSKQLNSELKLKHDELYLKSLEISIKEPRANKKQIASFLLNRKPIEFEEYAAKVWTYYKYDLRMMDKIRSQTNEVNKFIEYKQLGKVLLTDINISFVNDYETYLRSVKQNTQNNIAEKLKFLRNVINRAIKEDLIKSTDSPFRNIKIKKEKTTRVYLTEEEVARIANYPFELYSKLDLCRDLFIFACECGGIRISDVLTLKVKNYSGTHICFMIRKTNRQIQIKVPDKAKLILNKYLIENKDSEHYIFPILDNDIDNTDFKDQRRLYLGIDTFRKFINIKLKKIAKICNINKDISFHISRHTFATRALIKGISIEIIQKILGHSTISETQIYAKIVNSEIDKAMDLI